MSIDCDRLWQTIMESARIGTFGTGLARLALGDADRAMRDRFVGWCREAGLAVSIDAMGNIFARREGRRHDLPPVYVGSHLDSQQEGGRFDGVLGVLGGLEVIRALNDVGYVTRRPLVLVNWTNEEGARFPPPMLGSGVFAGAYDLEWAHAIRATDTGDRLDDELARIGYRGGAMTRPDAIDGYLELHIEQGPRLERAGAQIGVVTNAATVHGFRVGFTGETAHAGTRPMEQRRNALVAGARFGAMIDDVGQAFARDGGMATLARITATPNKAGILSNSCEVTGDVRHQIPARADAMAEAIDRAMERAARTARCEIDVRDRWHWGGAIFDEQLIGHVRHAAEEVGLAHMDIASQAGHDAYHLAKICPTAMIFVPCHDGITHHPAESITPEAARAGADVLLHAIISWADREA